MKKDLISNGCGIAAKILLLPLSKRLQRKARTKVDQRFFDYSPIKLVLIIKFYLPIILSTLTLPAPKNSKTTKQIKNKVTT